MSVLIVGSLGLDTIKTPQGRCIDILGGSVSYASISASYFGPVRMVAVAGSDFPGKYIGLFRSRGIDVRGLVLEKGKTFRWEGEYGWDFGDPRTIATHLNVFAAFDPLLPADYRDSRCVFLANIDPVIQEKVLSQIKRPKLVLCDTMNYWIDRKRTELLRLIKKVDIFLLNESEARQLSGQNSVYAAAKSIMKAGAKSLIIKKGEHGAMLFRGRKVFCVPAYLLESIYDPTGAGDTFAGGFIGYLAASPKIDDAAMRRAVVYGNIMATFTVEAFSVNRLAAINRKDIERRYREFRKLVTF